MTATARAFRLLTPNAGNEVVRTGVRGSPSRHIYTGKNLKMLSAVATKTATGGIYVTIVNKARTWRIPTRVAVRGKPIKSAVVKELVGPSYLSYNSYHHPGRVSIRTRKQWVKSSSMELKVPPHSVVTLKLQR
jgi:alpha-L-arabinofuranosidase